MLNSLSKIGLAGFSVGVVGHYPKRIQVDTVIRFSLTGIIQNYIDGRIPISGFAFSVEASINDNIQATVVYKGIE